MAKSTKMDDVKRPGRAAPSATSRPIIVTNRAVLTNDPMVVPGESGNADEPKSAPPLARTAKTIKPLDSTLKADSSDEETPKQSTEEVAKSATTAPETKLKPMDLPIADVGAAESEADPNAKPEETPAESKPEVNAEPEAEPKPEQPAEEPSDAADKETSETATPDAQPEEAKPEPTPEVASEPVAPGRDPAERDTEAELSAEEVAVAEAQTAREQELEKIVDSGKYFVPINAVQRKRSRMHTLALCLLALVLAAALLDVVLDVGLVRLSVSIPHTHFFSTT